MRKTTTYSNDALRIKRNIQRQQSVTTRQWLLLPKQLNFHRKFLLLKKFNNGKYGTGDFLRSQITTTFPIRISRIAEKTETTMPLPSRVLKMMKTTYCATYTIELWFDNKCFDQRGRKRLI
ncbi:hypothetical protein AVEN_247268-1 [Araneus ventricosus]|uniref:Uncharacterized protein n=1 Tax=Araneus ventricosus TaxID=182803 RepID=A0A4Y2UF47_ARAVE|nr:hypothetical protein AVEN_247268-1 [Araneus ventricosus]